MKPLHELIHLLRNHGGAIILAEDAEGDERSHATFSGHIAQDHSGQRYVWLTQAKMNHLRDSAALSALAG